MCKNMWSDLNTSGCRGSSGTTSHESGGHSRGRKCRATWHGYSCDMFSLFPPLLAPASSLPAPRPAGCPSICSQCPALFPRSQSHFLMVFASPCCLPHGPATLQLQVLLPVSSPAPISVVPVSGGSVQHRDTHSGPQR